MKITIQKFESSSIQVDDAEDEFKPVLNSRTRGPLLNRLLASPKRKQVDKNKELYYSELSNKPYFFCFTGSDIYYIVRLKLVTCLGLSFWCQTSVWRDKNFFIYANIAHDVYWGYVFKKWNRVLSDRVHTPDGKNFWARRVEEAFKKKYKVYLIDTEKDSGTELKNYEHFLYHRPEIWGSSPDYQNIRLGITK
jgi:hypothetical protein